MNETCREHYLNMPDTDGCPYCRITFLLARVEELERENEAYKVANRRMHNMIIEIRTHVKAWDTPTAPTDDDIVKCVTGKFDDARRSVFERCEEAIRDNFRGRLREEILISIRNEMSTSLCPTCKKHPCEHSHGGKVTVCVLYDEMGKGE